MKKIFVFFVVICLCLSFTAVQASTVSDLQNQISDIDSKLDKIKQQKSEAEGTADDAQFKVDDYTNQRVKETIEKQQMESDLDVLYDDIAGIEDAVDKAEADYNEKSEEFIERSEMIYKYNGMSYLQIILKSENILDFFTRVKYITKVAESDKQLMNDLQAAKAEYEYKLQLKQQSYASTEALIEEKNLALADISRSQSVAEETLKNSLDMINTLNEQEKQMESDSNALAEKIKELQKVTANKPYSGGTMLWPAEEGTYISSDFGPRIHPIFGTNDFHTGIDIPAPYGTNVFAANDGVVIFAGPNGGYGNLVVVDHGGGISTAYGHNSKIVVEVGQKVTRGEVIAKIGATGNATGNHCHFEVRIDGTAVDPKPYLKG
jgi:murein DD-endopeptidase MepM/ murein hydrolase activator NlpD